MSLGDESAYRLIVRDNERARARLVEELEFRIGDQINESWKTRRLVLCVPWKGHELCPAFQFRDGQPHPSVGKILSALPRRMTSWQILFWLTSSNGWPDGAAPAERLDEEEEVVRAALREREPFLG